MKKTASLAAILGLMQMCLGQDLIYTASPGFQTHNQRQDVTLSWRVTTTGAGFRFWSIYLYLENRCLIWMFAGTLQDCDGTRRGLLSINDTHVNYAVQNTASGDAGQYTCAVNTGPTFHNDSNAVLYIFDTLNTPQLSTSGRSQEGRQFSLQCHAVSTSLPTANRPQVNMLYIWRNNSEELDPGDLPERYSITSSGDPTNAVNDLLVITGLSRHDTGSYTCKAHEDGSDLQSSFSNSYDLEPSYTPDHASPGADQTVVAGDDVTLSCSADDHGRPYGSWIWTTPSGDVVNTSDVGQLTMTEASVVSNDGEYSCHLNNHVGDGARGYVTVTVFDGPSILSFEVVTSSGPINQHDDVTFLCRTDSRPIPVITLITPSGDTLVSSSTSNTLEHTLIDIDCLDSGYYKCVAFNARTGRIRSTLLPITVQCPPRKHIISDTRVAAAEGETVTFSISVVAFPEPTFTWDQRYAGHVTMTSSNTWCSLHVCVSLSIIIPHIKQIDFGNYSVTASNPLGIMEDVVFSLTAPGKPDVPSQLRVHHVNAVSITMQWTSGWNRGGEQVFTLMYRRSDSDDGYTNITDISDPGKGETVTCKAAGLLPDTSYDFMVLATNHFGLVKSQQTLSSSAAKPRLDQQGSLSVTISGDKAVIKWPINSYNGPITHVDVNSCDVSSDRCILTTVLNITSPVQVAVSEGGSSYTFVFRVYDGVDLLLNVNHARIDTGTSTGLVVGVVVAVVLLCAVAAVIGIIVWRRKGRANKGRDPRQRQTSRQMCDTRPEKNYENDPPREWEVSSSDYPRMQQEQSPYEQIEDSAHLTLSAPSVYERPQEAQSKAVPAVYETLQPNIDPTYTAGRLDDLELSEYANTA